MNAGFNFSARAVSIPLSVSNSWLDVNYGAPLQKYLLDNTAGAVICHSEASREFESADINTIVSVIQNGTPDEDSHIRFLTFKTFIGDSDVENRRERNAHIH